MTPDAEFGYELLVCRHAELAWHPSEGPRPAIVSRQLGTQERRWDTVVIEVDPAAFDRRRAFGDRTIDSDLLHVVRGAPAEWAFYRDALPDPGYPWRYVRQAVHRAAGRDLIEKRRDGNRIQIRRKRPYPDWVERIVAVENKPDLDRSAADRLADQLEHDVETALADEAWLATETTGERVEPALLREMPVEAGVLATDFSGGVDAAVADVAWHPSDLSPSGGERRDPETETLRLEIAERAYGKGWRSFHDTMRPDCRHFELRREGRALVPYCAAKGKVPTARECSGSCPEFSPEPPQWRTKGWPIEGGPGKGFQRVLARRRERERDRAETVE
ncbi:hypothetical protein C463_15295 [Halorubrum californiense DSM 19288]|uniref:Uncharacterized protein n=1 Tax=Halorubrum californiense DSM 19288 TaxID=1227465 RepID=M0DXR0_9EURY|nr:MULTISPECIES: DUF5787 family protein [Halorubrum]ELZ40296.1 hypothetical protein C463_15295 [Halorubrum californiense DSM 19288]TKX68127.1 hypothetical protein EXE40_13380 [Halorubrum sp. GN11GM_10-3_MGM]